MFGRLSAERELVRCRVQSWPDAPPESNPQVGTTLKVSDARVLAAAAAAKPDTGVVVAALVEHPGGLSIARFRGSNASMVPLAAMAAGSGRDKGWAIHLQSDGRSCLVVCVGDSIRTLRVDLQSGTCSPVIEQYSRSVYRLEIRRNGLDLYDPYQAEWVETSSSPFTSPPDGWVPQFPRLPDTLSGNEVPERMRNVEIDPPFPRLLETEGKELRLVLLYRGRDDTGAFTCGAKVLGRLDPATGALLVGTSRRERFDVYESHEPFSPADVVLLPRHELIVADLALVNDQKFVSAVNSSGVSRVSGMYHRASPTERAHFIEHPFDSAVGFMYSQIVTPLFNGRDNPDDAMRHALWAAMIASVIGKEDALHILQDHEVGVADPFGVQMDSHNNEVGAELGARNPGLSVKEMLVKVRELEARGFLLSRSNPKAPAVWKAAKEAARNAAPQGGHRGSRHQTDPFGHYSGHQAPQHGPTSTGVVELGPTTIEHQPPPSGHSGGG